MLLFLVGLVVGYLPLQQYKYDICKENKFRGKGCSVEKELCYLGNDASVCEAKPKSKN